MPVTKKTLDAETGICGTGWTRDGVTERNRSVTDSKKITVTGELAWEESPVVPANRYHGFTNLCAEYLDFTVEAGRQGDAATERSGFSAKHTTLRHGSVFKEAKGDLMAHQVIAMSWGCEVPTEASKRDFNWLPTTGGYVLHCHAMRGGGSLGGNEHGYWDHGRPDIRMVHHHVSLHRDADPYGEDQHRYLKNYVGGLDIDSYGSFGADYALKASGRFNVGLDLSGLMNPVNGLVAAMVIGSGVPLMFNGRSGEPVVGWQKDQTAPPTMEDYGGAGIRYSKSWKGFVLTDSEGQDKVVIKVEDDVGLYFWVEGRMRKIL